MTPIKLAHIKTVTPARGGTYYYFDTGKLNDKGKRIYNRLPDPSDPSFGGTYASLLGHRNRRARVAAEQAHVLTLPKLIALFEKSPHWRKLAPNSQTVYRRYLARIVDDPGYQIAPAAEITRGDVQRLMDANADHIGVANAMLRSMGALYAWAIGREIVKENPTRDVERFTSTPHDPWPQHVLQAALASDDAQVRLATTLLYFTAQRVGDIVRARWDDIAGNVISVRQEKTGKAMRIPMHRDLAELLATTPRRQLTILTNETGTGPISRGQLLTVLSAFGRSHGAHIVTHGLRKNAVNALLEAGCSAAETAAISGQSLVMVEHYAKARNQDVLGGAAVLKWERK
jgi:integrase